MQGALTRHPSFRKPQFDSFQIAHFAGLVEYHTTGWLEKNKDAFEDELTNLMRSSESEFIAGLWDEAVLSWPFGRRTAKAPPFISQAMRIQEQLRDVVECLASTNCQFVRCIVPNYEQRPGLIVEDTVLDQIRCNGILECLRLGRKGFPDHLPFHYFQHRFSILGNCKGHNVEYKADARGIINFLAQEHPDKVRLANVQFGLTQIFFRAGQLARLEQIRDEAIGKIILPVQACVRAFLAARRREAEQAK